MFGRIMSMLIGFVFACLAAGIAKVLFWYTPATLSALPYDTAMERLGDALELALGVATHSASVAAPFALVGAAIGEWRGIREWTFYALLGVAIAVVGFLAQYQSEAAGQPTIVNNYALSAFLTAGFVGGLVYWLVAGRHAGGHGPRPTRPLIEVMPPARREGEGIVSARGEAEVAPPRGSRS